MSVDAANAGFIRPPLIFLFAVVAGLVLNQMWPLQSDLSDVTKLLSILVFASGIVVFGLARKEFLAAATPIAGSRPATELVTSGVFRFSRNPIYVSFILLYSSVFFWTQILWLLLTLLFPLAVVDRIVIPREEKYMQSKFGGEYLNYRATVRRWL